MNSREGRGCQALPTPVHGRGYGRGGRCTFFLSTSWEGNNSSSNSASPALEAAEVLQSWACHAFASKVPSAAIHIDCLWWSHFTLLKTTSSQNRNLNGCLMPPVTDIVFPIFLIIARYQVEAVRRVDGAVQGQC